MIYIAQIGHDHSFSAALIEYTILDMQQFMEVEEPPQELLLTIYSV